MIGARKQVNNFTNAYKQHHVNEDINQKLKPPAGWLLPGDIEENRTFEDEQEMEKEVICNLSLATQNTEQLIDTIERRTSIKIPRAYMRVEADTKFHVVLLVHYDCFHSPEIVVAHILADDLTKKENRFDIHFSFSIQTEFIKRSTLYPDEYKLMYEHSDHDTNL